MFYPKIETLFERDPVTFKIIPGKFRNEIYSLINEWEFTEKIDGTNIGIVYETITPPLKTYYRKMIEDPSNEKCVGISYQGRTSNADIPKGIIKYLDDKIDIDIMFSLFQNKKVIFFGEGYGHKIQNGYNYILTSDPYVQKFIIFDINVNGYWLKRENIEYICKTLGLDVVPLIRNMPLEEGINLVKDGFSSNLANGSVRAEGFIGRTKEPLFDSQGRRLIIKLKTSDFQKSLDTFYESKN